MNKNNKINGCLLLAMLCVLGLNQIHAAADPIPAPSPYRAPAKVVHLKSNASHSLANHYTNKKYVNAKQLKNFERSLNKRV